MAYDPNFPPTNALLVSAEFRDQFNGMKAIIDAQGVPVGCVLAYLKTLAGVPALPATWVECNGQVLNDAQSPLNGATIPNLNGASGGARRFLRGANASGGTGGADTHAHAMPLSPATLGNAGSPDQYNLPASGTTSPASSLPSYYEVVWVMRVK